MATSIKDIVPLFSTLPDRELDCERHGSYIAHGKRFPGGRGREIWTMCPGCQADQAEAVQRAADEMAAKSKQAKLERLLNQTAIPARFIGRSFENFRATTDEQRKALAIASEFASGFPEHLRRGSCLVFSGQPGTGKSHLAASILQSILPTHVGVYMTFMGMIRLIRETWHPASLRRESEVLADLGSVPLLVIDEIGVQYGTEAEHTLLFEVMDRRYRDQMPTILLTNQDKDGFKKFVGDRVYDRMTETARWVNFDWSSFRTQARKEFQ